MPLLFLLILLFVGTAAADELHFDLSKVAANGLPEGFESTVSGKGKPGIWQIIEDELPSAIPSITDKAPVGKRPVLAQISRDITDEHYPILVYTNQVFGDFKFSTRFKCVAGAIEQMAGLVFRYQDPLNYYYVRASAKGSTFRFFKVVAGQRGAPIGPEMPIAQGVWQDLAVECRGNQIICYLNGKQAIPTMTDHSFSSGKIGFWTKSDSVSYFAEPAITYTPREPLARVVLREMKERYPRVLGLRIYGKPAGKPDVMVVASTDEAELEQPATDVERNAIRDDQIYYGKLKPGVVVTMPLHDRNGETIAALRVEMTSFFGQTEGNAIARAMPIKQAIERRFSEARDLF